MSTQHRDAEIANTAPAKIETKQVKHTFSMEERNTIGADLARSIALARGIEAEEKQVKAGYKAKTEEAAARIDMQSTQLMNGFEFRLKRCRVTYRPKERKKEYRLEEDSDTVEPVLVEDMIGDDFQAELIAAESKFELREELELFQRTGTDSGILVVGRFQPEGKPTAVWFAALRITIGQRRLEERLDSEQRSTKKRPDAVKTAAKRALEWLQETLGKENAKGFSDGIAALVEAHKEREE